MFVAPENGFVQLGNSSKTIIWVAFNNYGQSIPVSSSAGCMCNTPKMPVRKGDVVQASVIIEGASAVFEASFFEYAAGAI